jgi:hypothetical protein
MAEIVWAPHPGSQTFFLACPHYECLFEGTRGPGKTDALLMDFAQHVGRGLGRAWRGVLFRRTTRQHADLIAKTRRWFPRIFPGARFNSSRSVWTFPAGEELLLRYLDSEADYWEYHGHEYPWIGFEELTQWPTGEGYEAVKSCCRSAHPDVPRKVRATCNPHGPGHNWVKARFVDPAPAGVPVTDEAGLTRVRIHGRLAENEHLLAADPDYARKLAAIPDPVRRKAWLEGDWDIVSGGALDDVFDRAAHVLPPFPIPASWRIDRSFDWGSARPWSVGFWAESDGTRAKMPGGAYRTFPAGTLFRVAELYGWTGRPDQGDRRLAADVAREIVRTEREHALLRGRTVHPGPADTQIFDAAHGRSIADEMAREKVRWRPADKRPGSRKAGLERLRLLLARAREVPPEAAGLYVFEGCTQFLRTVPVLPRSSRDPDDVDTTCEDHVYDEVRYRIMDGARTATSTEILW